jgi:hypothetical protein
MKTNESPPEGEHPIEREYPYSAPKGCAAGVGCLALPFAALCGLLGYLLVTSPPEVQGFIATYSLVSLTLVAAGATLGLGYAAWRLAARERVAFTPSGVLVPTSLGALFPAASPGAPELYVPFAEITSIFGYVEPFDYVEFDGGWPPGKEIYRLGLRCPAGVFDLDRKYLSKEDFEEICARLPVKVQQARLQPPDPRPRGPLTPGERERPPTEQRVSARSCKSCNKPVEGAGRDHCLACRAAFASTGRGARAIEGGEDWVIEALTMFGQSLPLGMVLAAVLFPWLPPGQFILAVGGCTLVVLALRWVFTRRLGKFILAVGACTLVVLVFILFFIQLSSIF